ncbi:hypothetical protein ABIG06_005644 [Bradyrhizobium sp. USDA 326]|uniref:hypothetical protein n=1 Tax=Bradyrhizobium sp. USDA 326 TaxID=3377726 RepID=UPI003C787D9B
MTRWEALVRYDDEIRKAASNLMPFGAVWVEKLGEAFFALNEDRQYLSNIVDGLVREATQEAEIEWLDNFSKTKEGETTSQEALRVLLEAKAMGFQVSKSDSGIVEIFSKSTGSKYLWSNEDIIQFGKLVLKR